MNNQKGMSSILVIIAVLAIVGVFVLYLYNMSNSANIPFLDMGSEKNNQMNTETPKMEPQITFEKMDEDESTPVEINNDVVSELDSIVAELESDKTLDSDLKDLEL